MHRYRIHTNPETGEKHLGVTARGLELKDDPMLNKGTAFTEEERLELGLQGLLPAASVTMEQQLTRVRENYLRQPDDLARYLYLIALQDRNETLFYRLLLDNLEEMIPIVYTPTVGQACQKFSHIYRRARGLFVTASDRERMGAVLANAPFRGVSVIVATDGEGILGIGDQGAGGIGISIGKLTLYTVAAGIHPARCLPICLDLGTSNPDLRTDPLYLGVRQPRLRGEPYFEVLDRFVDAVSETFPGSLLQWEDFSRQNAASVLDRYRERLCSFNDDIQGTGAVVLAALLQYARLIDRKLADQRFCVHGAGAAGSGIINAIASELTRSGLSAEQARDRIVALDSRGLILSDRPGLLPYKRPLAADRALVSDWDLRDPQRIDLADVVTNFRPTVLIGVSGRPGSFSQAIVEQMCRNADRPAILGLSNPSSRCEADPRDVVEWSRGRALFATGSPFAPVSFEGSSHVISQCNNLLCFPGIGLGCIAAQPRMVTDAMLHAAAVAVADFAPPANDGRLLPGVSDVRKVSRAVAMAVANAAVDSGVTAERLTPEEVSERVLSEIWYPEYVPYRAK